LTLGADQAELALSAWGRWDDELDPTSLGALQVAFMRRRRWEARLLAVEVVRALGMAMGGLSTDGTDRTGGTVIGQSGRRYQWVAPEAMIRTIEM